MTYEHQKLNITNLDLLYIECLLNTWHYIKQKFVFYWLLQLEYKQIDFKYLFVHVIFPPNPVLENLFSFSYPQQVLQFNRHYLLNSTHIR